MSTTETATPLKVYVLLPSMDVNAPVYTRINKDQRVRVDKLPLWVPYLKITYQKGGKNTTIRYKETATSIFLNEQIKDQGIPANDPFTENERRAMEFKNGVLATNNAMIQNYLDNYPANEAVECICPDIKAKVFKVYDKADELKSSNEDFKLRTKAASKIVGLNLKQAQEMLIRLNGSFFEVPSVEGGLTEENALIECQDLLVSFLDASEKEGLDAILLDEKEETAEDTTKILVGKLVNANVISFEESADQISKKSNGQWVKLMDMPGKIELPEQERLLIDFLNSEEGKVHLTDLQNELQKIDNK